MERKGFGWRLLAALIDVLIVFGFGCIVLSLTGAGMVLTGRGRPIAAPTTGAWIGGIISALFGLAYFSTEIFMAASPGKMILKMTIGSDTGVIPAPQDQLIKRWAIKHSASLLNLVAAITTLRLFSWLAFLAALVIIVGCFFALGVNKQALHDVLARTAVYGATTVMQQGFQPIMPPPSAPYPPGGPGAPPPPPPPPQV